MTTLQKVHEQALSYKALTFDDVTPARNVYMDSNGNIVSPDLPRPATPTRSAFGHLTSFFKGTKKYPVAPNIGRATEHIYTDMPADLRAVVTNYWLSEIAGKKLLLRGYDRGGEDLELRAVASAQYGIVDHWNVTEALQFAFNDILNKISVARNFMTDEVMHLRLTIPAISKLFEFNGFRQVYTAGIYVSNGTIKNRSLIVSPFIQGTSCSNSTVFHEEYGLVRTHSGLSVLAARNHIYEMASTCLGHTQEIMERMFDSALKDIHSPSEVIGQVMDQLGLSEDHEVGNRIMNGMMSQGGLNLFGLSNGLSFAAQAIENEETRVNMEMLSGSVIMADPDDLFGHIAKQKFDMAEVD